MSCCTVYRDGGARTVIDRMRTVARYYDISSKADRGDIFIVHEQKSSNRTPLVPIYKNKLICWNCSCMYVCMCVCVFVTYEDTNLYNNMGMTGITRRR